MSIKGIVLAGGNGIRLYPHTLSLNKHLLPIYDKPMIYYSLSILMLAKIRNILIITKKEDIKKFKNLLGNGERIGVNITYEVQNKPKGIAEAFLIGKNFIGKSSVSLILGDNILYGEGLIKLLDQAKKIVSKKKKAVIFGYKVKNPKEFGIIKLKKNKIIKIVEKPKKSKSNLASIGLYFYPNSVIKIAQKIKPSKRSELEITDLNNIFVKQKKIHLSQFGRGTVWYDAGNSENLLKISNLIYDIQIRNSLKISCLEEIAFNYKWINKSKIKKNLKLYSSSYQNYLKKIIHEK
jgi:glucose-1-phosphate thymidylyltransferase